MNRRQFLRRAQTAGLAAAATSCARAAAPAPAPPTRRPNLLFLLADDMRWDAMSCVGHPQLKTPHLDRLAAEGVLFRNAFVTTSICAPNRACVLLGQHQRTTGIKDFRTPLSTEQLDRTYPVLLRKAGYRTGFLGKWGVGASNEEMLKLPAGRFDYWRGFVGQGKFFWEHDGKQEHLTTERIPRQAAEFLDGCRPGQTWCLSISFKAPHGPWQDYDRRFKDLFTGDDLPKLPATFTKAHVEALPPFIRHSLNCLMPAHYEARWGKGADPKLPEKLVAMYYRLIVGLDLCVGRLMAELRRRGLDDNTVVIFTSDNGHFLFERGLFGKWLMHEPSIRVPLIVRDPRLPQAQHGTRRDEMALTIDCAPTLLALAGLPIPKTMQGRDLSPLLRGGHVPWRSDWFYEHTFTLGPPRTIAKCQGVRAEGWKYVRYLDTNPHAEQLFDLAADPDELHDLAAQPDHQKTLAALRERYQHYRTSLPDVNPEPKEYGFYRTVALSAEPAESALDLAPQRAVGQTFVAEGQTVHALHFRTPTWGKAAPTGLAVELRAGGPTGKLLAKGVVPKRQIVNNRMVAWQPRQAVALGSTLTLRIRPTKPIPPRTIGLYHYDEDLYVGGTAHVDGRPAPFDLQLAVTYQDREGFKPPSRGPAPTRTKYRVHQGRERRRGSPDVAGKAIAIAASIAPTGTDGTIVSQGGSGNGYALYLKEGRLAMATRHGGKLTAVVAPQPLPKGRVAVEGRLGRDGSITLLVAGQSVATGKAPGPLSAQPGDPLEGGGDHHTPVGDYAAPHPFPGRIHTATVQVTD